MPRPDCEVWLTLGWAPQSTSTSMAGFHSLKASTVPQSAIDWELPPYMNLLMASRGR